MIEKYYPIHSQKQLSTYFDSYIPLILNQLNIYGIDLHNFGIQGDHLGLQVLSPDEFDTVNSAILNFASPIKIGEIHSRRNNTYKLNDFLFSHSIEIQSIEIFEPKPDANLLKLKPGFEHIAFKVDKYDELLGFFHKNNLPIDKMIDFEASRSFKTKFINLVEIEFRTNYLWKDLIDKE